MKIETLPHLSLSDWIKIPNQIIGQETRQPNNLFAISEMGIQKLELIVH